MRERHQHSFLSGGGEMGTLIRAFDWGATPIGEPDTWPQGLRTSVRTMLSTGHPIFIFWGSELIQFYNDAYCRSLGPERHPSALGQRGHECWEEIWHIIGPQIEQVMSGHGFTWHENQLVPTTRHGKREDVWWTYSYGPIDEPDMPNGVGGVLVICSETTQKIISEKRLKEADAAWRSLFDSSPAFMAIMRGPGHVFEYANRRYRELTNWRDVVGKSVLDALPEVEEQGFIKILDDVFQSGEAYSGTATPITLISEDENAQLRYLDFVYEPIRDENANAEVTGILVVGFDVTELVTTAKALQEQDLRKDHYLAMLGHELRNPLAPIVNGSEMLKLRTQAGSQEHAVASMISRQAQQLTRLLDDLLDVSRISTGRIELKKETVTLNRILDLSLESVRPQIREKQQHLELNGPEDLYVEADTARLVQAVSNILHNAMKFSEAGQTIRIETHKEAGSAYIAISDEGAGISPEMAPTIFDLFVQDARTLDQTQGGLGIGLALVHILIEMHGGQVTALSKGPGSGSTFTIRLPLVENPHNTATHTEEHELSAKRILVVDDNVDSADSLAQLLTALGHDARPVHSAEEALRNVQSQDAILLDIGLPQMDGYEVARRIRAQGFENLMVAVTGYGQPEDIRKSLDAGFDAHLTKPIGLEAVQEILRSGPRPQSA